MRANRTVQSVAQPGTPCTHFRRSIADEKRFSQGHRYPCLCFTRDQLTPRPNTCPLFALTAIFALPLLLVKCQAESLSEYSSHPKCHQATGEMEERQVGLR